MKGKYDFKHGTNGRAGIISILAAKHKTTLVTEGMHVSRSIMPSTSRTLAINVTFEYGTSSTAYRIMNLIREDHNIRQR